MKRAAVFLMIVLSAGAAPAADRLMVSIGIGCLQPADAAYREIYGSKVFFPEAAAGVRFAGNLYIVGGYGWFARTGKTPDLGLDARSSQRFLWAGLGFVGPVAKGLEFKIEAGAAGIFFKEEAMEIIVSGSRLGFLAGAGLLVSRGPFFAGLDMGYVAGAGTVEDVKIKLGGPKASFSLGFRAGR